MEFTGNFAAQRKGSVPVETTCCVPGTAYVDKGAFNIAFLNMSGKSQTRLDGGKGYSVIAKSIR